MEHQESPRIVLAAGYPPPRHILRDLKISVEFRSGGRSIVRAPVVREVCSDQGAMQAGIVATLVDVLGGALSIRTVYPGWTATADLSVHTSQLAKEGYVAVSGSVLRAGRTRVVIAADIQQELRHTHPGVRAIGCAILTFSRLSAGEHSRNIPVDEGSPARFELALPDSGVRRSSPEAFGVRVLEPACGAVELEMSEYVRNSLGSLQGGMLAILGDTAGQLAARAATGKPLTTSDLTIHYLLPGKVGPFRTEARVLRTTSDTALTQIKVVDAGAEDQLIGVVMNSATMNSGPQ